MTFLLRRLYSGILLFFAVSVLSFALFEIAPGNYLDEMLASPQIPRETVESFRERFGLDQPVVFRYFHWLASTLRGDLGLSFAYNMPVSQILWGRVVNTILLSGLALLVTWGAALPLGVCSASRRNGWIARSAGASASALVAVPDLLIGLALLLFAARTGFFRVSGSLALCVLALALVSFPAVFRHTRSSMLEVLDAPFVEHLRAAGILERRILFRHALPAAMNPLLSLFGLSLASMLSSGLIIEVILGWPGLGPLLLESILARDIHVVLGAVMVSTLVVLAGSLIADLLLYTADPRIRVEAP